MKDFGQAIKGTWAALSASGKFTLAGLGIGLAISAVSFLNEQHEKQIQLAQENAEAYAESAKSIEAYKKEAIDLINSLESGTLSDEETYKARSRLYEIEESLSTAYGNQADNLKLLTQNAKQADDAFTQLAKSQANQYLGENEKNIKKATKQMTKIRTYDLGVFDWNKMSPVAQAAVEEMLSGFDNVGLVNSFGGNKTLKVVGNSATEIYDTINKVKAGISDVDAELRVSGNSLSSYFDSDIDKAMNNIGDVIDNYGSQYTEGINAAITANDQYTGILNSIEDAESDYTKAMSDSYDSTEDRAKAMSEAQDVVNDTIQEYQNARSKIWEDNIEVGKFFDNEIEGLKKYQKLLDFDTELASSTSGGRPTDRLNAVANALDKLRNAAGKIDADYINSIGLGIEDGIDNEQEQAYSDLVEALDAYGIELQDAIPILKAYGIMQKSIGSILGDATKAYNTVIAEQEAVNNAYKSQSPGKSVSLDTYKSLIALSDEYANCLEYENGALQLNRRELMQLSKARAEENLLTIESNQLEAQQRYEENTQLISKYRAEIRGAKGDAEKLIPTWEDYIEKLEEQNKAIKESIVEYALMAAAVRESTSEYSDWVNAQSETQASAWHESVVSGLAQIKQIYTKKEYGNTALQEGLEFLTNAQITNLDNWHDRMIAIDGAYKQLSARIDGTSYSLNSFLQPGKTGANNFLRAIQQINGEWASFDYATQTWTLDYNNKALADKLGTTEEFVVMMNKLLEQYGFEFDDDQLTTAAEKTRSLEERVTSLRTELESTDIDGAIGGDKLKKLIDDIKGANLTPEVEEEKLQEAYDLVDEYVNKAEQPVFMNIKTSQVDESMRGALTDLQNFQTALNEVRALEIKGIGGAEMEGAQQKVNDLASQIASLPQETLLSIGLNLDGVAAEDLATTIQSQLPNVSIPVIGDIVIDEEKTVLVTYKKDSSEIDNYDPPNLTRTVTYTLGGYPGAPKNGSDGGSGGLVQVNGSLQTSGPARANGNIGAVPGGKTLVGELGREMYVDPATNTWHTIGDNGPEFVNLPRNAIVFNHLQTQSLLSKGKTSARGKALVSGNAAVMVTREDPNLQKGSNPFLNNSGGVGPGLNPSGSGGSGSSKSKKKSFKDLYKEHQHLLAMEQETTAEYLAWLEKAYQEAYEKGQISLDEYNKYMEEVYELQKEVFMDSLNDIEHQISILEREAGNESAIIEMYQGMMESLEAEMQAARDRGLDDNSDYIQELQDQYYSYMDAIEEIQEEIKNNAMDAVDELVDFKIEMIKQDLENEKDALNDRLDELRDFYDEQKEMLRDAHDEEKYLEEQKEKRKSVSDIQSEIAQLSRDNSAWAQKRRLELQEELLEAQKELDDFEKDHSYDQAQDFLDKMQEQQEEQIQSQIEAIDEKLNDPNAIYNQALAAIQNNTADLYNEMVEYNNRFGDGNPETVKKMWDDAYESLNAYLQLFAEAYKDIVLPGDSDTVSGYASGTRSATPGVHTVNEEGEEYIFKASDGKRYKMFSGGEKVLNARATNFLYDFATSGGAILTEIFDKMFGSMSLGNIRPSTNTLQLSTGDIIIQGNADQRTVSEIRRAQRDNIDYILKEFHKLNR